MTTPPPVPPPATTGSPEDATAPASAAEVFRVYLRLGCTCFGGPLAHIGIFRAEFVDRRRWLDTAAFAELLSLSQVLPGPTSSQLGFLIGWQRARLPGALAAWTGFTAPSLVLMISAGLLWSRLPAPVFAGAMPGIALAVLAIVVQAVIAMATTLCRGVRPAGIAVIAAALTLALPGPWAQPGALAVAAGCGWWLLRSLSTPASPGKLDGTITVPNVRLALGAIAILASATAAALVATTLDAPPPLRAAAACFHAGALVFGGGHVVLPLLEPAVVGGGLLDQQRFLGGYGLTQVMPGPLFTFAGFVGAGAGMPSAGMAVIGGLLCGVVIFVPGLTLALAGLRIHGALRTRPAAAAALRGLAAGSVGILAAACVRPLGTSAIHGGTDAGLALLALAVLWLRAPPWAVVVGLGVVAAVMR